MQLDIEGMPITDEEGNNICQGCEDTGYPGIRYPSDVNGDTSRPWVERCDYCERYDSDRDAARALVMTHEVGINIAFAVPMGCTGETPYVVGTWHRPENELPRLPSRKDITTVAPNLKALITEIPGDAWTEFCDLVNENHDLKFLLAEKEVHLARARGSSALYKESHAACVKLLNFFDPPSDF